MKKKLLMLAVSAVMTFGAATAAYGSQWQQDSTGWWYQNDNGSYATGWTWIDGKCYYFSDNGYMAANTNVEGYTLNSEGQWVVNGVVQGLKITTEQKQVMETLLSPIIYLDTFDKKEFLVHTSSFLDADLSNLLDWHLNNTYEKNAIIQNVEANEFGRSFDKAEALDHLADMYGKKLSETALVQDSFITFKGDKIIITGADGEGVSTPSLTNFKMKDGKLIVSGSYKTEFNVEELNTGGSVIATFIPNKDSFFGYTLESIQGY
ncbi:hypothetical protein [Lacrimispora amygdalina]|uniref:hypothetical protein n=1 Tax=Lacrimispora amygdalina TaxID=253257 RepID=UPI000BE2C98F|nr:hypothetical protein [Lacrimispora amygdalina]